MIYLAFTESVASWLLGKPNVIDAIVDVFVVPGQAVSIKRWTELIEGSFRVGRVVTSNDRNDVIGIWNADYLNGTGQESWGFVRVDGDLGVNSYKEIVREVVERCLYVISQRLNGLMISGTYFPRVCGANSHTCLAGRGADARHLSIGYYENVVSTAASRQQAIVCVGPEQHWGRLEAGIEGVARDVRSLLEASGALLDPTRQMGLERGEAFERIRTLLAPFSQAAPAGGLGSVEIKTSEADINGASRYVALSLTYDEWLARGSSLTSVQRRIIESDEMDLHPIRIVGPGGSGKTLLMQLLALRRVRLADERHEPLKVLYVVHNQAMERTVRQRFEVLMRSNVLSVAPDSSIEVRTLSRIARDLLELEDTYVIDTDAQEAKAFQYTQVLSALRDRLGRDDDIVRDSRLLTGAKVDSRLCHILAILVMSDISIAIKGQGLSRDRRKYVESARHLSRFHGALTTSERQFVFDVFDAYNKEVFENLEVLDSDDLAISLLGRVRTPIWELRRRRLGYDYVFVDETQLFNENERRVLPFLANGTRKHVPVVLALDEAQAIYGLNAAGFSALGIEGSTIESLSSIHRSTRSIVNLAFFVIQHSTELFGADFPDFTDITDRLVTDDHPLAFRPVIDRSSDAQQDFGKFVLKRVRELRKSNIRQIAVVVHADQYWDATLTALSSAGLPLHTLLTRGEALSVNEPIVVVTKPAFVGGQEFDAVVLVGLEEGVVPPKMQGGEALAATVEQQALREIYLSVTRARYRVVVALSCGASPSKILQEAVDRNLLSWGRGDVQGA